MTFISYALQDRQGDSITIKNTVVDFSIENFRDILSLEEQLSYIDYKATIINWKTI